MSCFGDGDSEREKWGTCKNERDLGVIVQDNLSPGKHISIVNGGMDRLPMYMKVAFYYTYVGRNGKKNW